MGIRMTAVRKQAKVCVILMERTAIGETRATRSAAMGEETVTVETEKETVTETQTAREVTSVGGTTATGGMEMTAARGIDPLSAIDSNDHMGTKFHVLVNIPCIPPTLTMQKKPKKNSAL